MSITEELAARFHEHGDFFARQKRAAAAEDCYAVSKMLLKGSVFDAAAVCEAEAHKAFVKAERLREQHGDPLHPHVTIAAERGAMAVQCAARIRETFAARAALTRARES